MRNGPLIVGVDGTEESERALRHAAWLAERCCGGGGFDLVVVFVRQLSWASLAVSAGGEVAAALDEVEAAARRIAGDVLCGQTLSWRFEVREGNPARELIRVAAEMDSQTIVVGGHRHGAIGSALVQSVDSELVHAFPGTLFIVRPPVNGRDVLMREAHPAASAT